ncbi:MAG: hypothetical protein WBQ21_00765 [Solirubrobacteraceae bacterium]
MGLLDDAIREHLELKRLQGADPGGVARQEQEALGPAHRGDETWDEERQDRQPAGPLPDDVPFSAEEESTSGLDLSAVGQETIEIDMKTVLDSDGQGTGPPHTSDSGRQPLTANSAQGSSPTGDSLEWEMPGDKKSELGEHPDDHNEAEHVEDVLEETPDFLRDTPEQERLWFEQRPPRDFDFNE